MAPKRTASLRAAATGVASSVGKRTAPCPRRGDYPVARHPTEGIVHWALELITPWHITPLRGSSTGIVTDTRWVHNFGGLFSFVSPSRALPRSTSPH